MPPQKDLHLAKFIALTPTRLLKAERDPSLKLSSGNIINGLVIENLSDQRMILSINGRRIIAYSKTRLPAGQKASFKVLSTSPNITLHYLTPEKKVNNENRLLAALKSQLPLKDNLGSLLISAGRIISTGNKEISMSISRELTALLRNVLNKSIVSSSDITSDRLKGIIYDSGVMFESKLRELLSGGSFTKEDILELAQNDLKGITYKVLEETHKTIDRMYPNKNILNRDGFTQAVGHDKGDQVLHNGQTTRNMATDAEIGLYVKDSYLLEHAKTVMARHGEDNGGYAKLSELIKELNKLIATIEVDQISNSITKNSGGYFVLQIPYSYDNLTDTARLYIYDNKKGNNKGDSKKKGLFSIALFLRMKYLGDIRTDVLAEKRSLKIDFFVSETMTVKLINMYSKSLRDNLSEYGFKTVIGVKKKTDVMKTETAFRQSFNFSGENIVDLHV